MSKAGRSVYLFSIYLMVMGAVLTIQPNLMLGMLRLPLTDEVWIRIVGMLAFIIGFYYFQSAKYELTLFFRWTVYGRLAGFLLFCILGLAGLGPRLLILFGVIDGLAALWTHTCLKTPQDPGTGVTKDSQ